MTLGGRLFGFLSEGVAESWFTDKENSKINIEGAMNCLFKFFMTSGEIVYHLITMKTIQLLPELVFFYIFIILKTLFPELTK